MHTKHTGITRIIAVKCTLAKQRIADRGINDLGKLTHLFGGTGKDCTAAYKDKRLLSLIDHLCHFIDLIHGISALFFFFDRLFSCIFGRIGCHILGNIHKHRTRSAAFCNIKCFADRFSKLCHILYDKAVLGNRHRNTCDIHLLKGILAKSRKCHIGGNGNNRNGIHISCRNTGDQIGRTRSACSHADTDLAGSSCITVCGMCSTLLMGCQNVSDLIAVLI